MTEHLTKATEGRFILADGFQSQFTIVRRHGSRSIKELATLHPVRKWREMVFSSLPCRVPAHRMLLPHSKQVLESQLIQSRNSLLEMLGGLSLK